MKNAKRSTAALGLLVLCSASAASAAEPQAAPRTRIEKDLLGEKEVPADAYYGVQTARALENFQISGIPISHYPGLHRGLRHREARRRARQHRRRAPSRRRSWPRSRRPARPCIDGKYHDQFRVDWYQGGAGTSTNMNANEVLANVGLELIGHKKGEYTVTRSARRPEHVAVHERLVPDRDQGRPHPPQRQAGRRVRAAGRRLPREGQRVPEDREDGPHGAAGRGPHDGRPGVPRVRRALEGEIQLLRDAEK